MAMAVVVAESRRSDCGSRGGGALGRGWGPGQGVERALGRAIQAP